MIVAGRQPYVAHREYHENNCLDDAYDRPERVKRERDNELRQASKNPEHGVVGEHVGVKTNTERKRTEQIVCQVDWDHEREQPPYRSDQVILQILAGSV